MDGISSQIVSFLASFKTFFFFALAFIVFGAGFLFLFQVLPPKVFLLKLINADFNNINNSFRFLVFSYIVGLLLYVFSLLCFRGWYNYIKPLLLKIHRKQKSETQGGVNDVEIIVYLEKHPGVSDIYTLQLLFSLISYLLFSFFASIIFFFALGHYIWIFIIIALLLFKIGLSANASVNAFGNQIKDVISKAK